MAQNNLPPGAAPVVAADFATLEARLASGYAATMQEDAHRAYAAELFGVPYHMVTAEQRRAAKAERYWDQYSGNMPRLK